MRSIFIAFCLCAGLTACTASGSTGLPPLPEQAAGAPGPASRPADGAISRTAPVAPPLGVPTPITARPGAISASNPSTAIVDVNRSTPAVLGINSPPPTSFENSCAPPPYLFQSRAGYEAARVKDCRNDQLVYLPSNAQTQINVYIEECQRRCGAR